MLLNWRSYLDLAGRVIDAVANGWLPCEPPLLVLDRECNLSEAEFHV